MTRPSLFEIELDPSEVEVIRLIATARYNAARAAGVHDAKIGAQSCADTDAEGFGGELAAAKLLNVYPDLSINPRSGGYDLMLPDGSRADIKTTKYPNGRLLATLKKTPDDIDVFILMVGQLPTYRFAGWVRAEELLDAANISDVTGAAGYCLEQCKLRRGFPG